MVCRRSPKPNWFVEERDFLADKHDYENIVMNPPFFRAKGAEAFIRQALDAASRKVAAFVDCRFLYGAGRAGGLFREFPPARVWMITPRPSCPPGEWLLAGNKAGGGTADYCWLVWNIPGPSKGTELGWLTADPGDVI